jgi:O-antigen/teichoic acid export membrane protein
VGAIDLSADRRQDRPNINLWNSNMDQPTIGVIGCIASGVLGGAIGTYFSIKNTNGPRERAFTVKVCLAGSLTLLACLLALAYTPAPYRYWLAVPMMIAPGFAIRAGIRHQENIRRQEAINA